MSSYVAPTTESFRVTLDPERMVLTDGIHPFLFRSNKGTLFLQASLTIPQGFIPAKSNGSVLAGNVLSRDGGVTWQRWKPKEWQQRLPHFEGAFTQLSDGTIFMVERVAEPTSRPGTFAVNIWESKDDLHTLGGPIRSTIHLPQARAHGFDDGGHPCSGIIFHRTVLELPNGDLLATVYCAFKEDNTPCSYQPKMLKLRCVLLRSRNRGRHWTFASTIAADSRVGEEGFNESAMVRLSKGQRAGRLICLMRTGCHDCPIHQATSDDDGATWSKPRALSFRGVDPDLIEMSDGTLACSFGWRTKNWATPTPPAKFGNYIVFSSDQGKNWTNLTRLPIEPHANTPWTPGYTSLREISRGELCVVYDIGRYSQSVRYIGSRRVKLTNA